MRTFFQYIRRRPCEFQLGKFNVLPGLDFAVRTMQRRERAKFIISSDLLYGEQGQSSYRELALKRTFASLANVGCPPRIPPKAWSLFVIEMISWIDCTLVDKLRELKTRDEDLTEDFGERIQIVQTFRDMGNVRKENSIWCLSNSLSSRMNMPSIITTEQFDTMPKGNSSCWRRGLPMRNKRNNMGNCY